MSYCTVLDVVKLSGIGTQIINESVGTGDGITTSFSLDNQNVVENSETVYVAGTAKTRNENYTINFNTGAIVFLTGSIPSSGQAITAHYKYLPDSIDITNSDMEDFIDDADAEIENWTGKKFTDSNSYIEYFEGRSEKVTASGGAEADEGQYWSETFEDKYVIILSKYPVQSITSVLFLNDDGTTDDTLTEADEDFHWWDYGKIQLISSSIPIGKGKKKIKVTYTYGYSEVPRLVKRLSSVLSSIIVFANLTGGSFDEITSYSLGPKSVSVGEPMFNLREAIIRLEQMKNNLLNQIGRDIRMCII